MYADSDSGVLAGAAAVSLDAADWMAEITLAIRAQVPVKTVTDIVHAFRTYGEALEAPPREIAGTNCQRAAQIREVER
jgi:dihydrolipoamide dehydrogenase